MDKMTHERLLIIDFGSQVTQLIARRLRELNVYCEIHPYQNVTDTFLADFAPKAVILSGGPDSVMREGSPRPPQSRSRLCPDLAVSRPKQPEAQSA